MGRAPKVFVAACLAAVLSGCAGKMKWVRDFEARGIEKAAVKDCDNAGYGVGTAGHDVCMQRVRAAYQQQAVEDQAQAQQDTLGMLMLGAALYGASQGRPAPISQYYSPRVCPDGSYVSGGTCYIAPDGSYHSAPPQIAPNGRYVGGTPRIAPDGSYVGGTGQITICPDGSYVAGRCMIAPNGKYVGAP